MKKEKLHQRGRRHKRRHYSKISEGEIKSFANKDEIDKGRMQVFFLALSYYFNLVNFVLTWLFSLVCHQCQRGRLLISNWNKLIYLKRRRLLILKRVSIIILSLMSNLLSMGKTIAYMIQVISFNWLMKKIWRRFDWWRRFEKVSINKM